jgi:hypothetical protein
MHALEEFQVTLTFCYTPEDAGLEPHYTSPPRQIAEFADFCAQMVRRYAPGHERWAPPPLLGNGRPRRGRILMAEPI